MLKTTTVGSFPSLSQRPSESTYFWLNKQLESNLDILVDGEQYGSIFSILDVFDGVQAIGNQIEVYGKIMTNPNLLSIPRINDFLANLSRLGKRNCTQKTKIGFIGPITCISCSRILPSSPYYGRNDPKLFFDYFIAIQTIVNYLPDAITYIQIDEPLLLSNDSQDLQNLINQINRIGKLSFNKNHLLCIHYCGVITHKLIDIIADSGCQILSMAFADKNIHQNLDIVTTHNFNSHKIKIGVGCIPTLDPLKHWTLPRSQKIISLLSEKLGEDRIEFIHPDCGLRNSTYNESLMALDFLNSIKDS